MRSNRPAVAPPSLHDSPCGAQDAAISFFLERGERRVLSRFNDPVWDFTPYVLTANTPRHCMLIKWTRLPADFVDGTKAVLHRYWVVGKPGGIRPTASTVILLFGTLSRFLHRASTAGAARLADISPALCMAYVHHSRQRQLSPRTQKWMYSAIEALHTFRGHHADSVEQHPWPDSTARRLAGVAVLDHARPSTKLIPCAIVERLFQGSLDLIERADSILDQRDRRGLSARMPELALLRSACYFVLGITSGCRNHELASIESGAIRRSRHDGEDFCWLRGVSLKTHHGPTEWMVPEIGVRCVRILERWAKPLQALVADKIADIDRKLRSTSTTNRLYARLLAERRALEPNVRRLFLGYTNVHGVTGLSVFQWSSLLPKFARSLGLDWKLTSHQLRRTFAANVASHVLGDLVYLKHHYKHWSMDMTALYALNEQQEEELFDEVLHAVRERKIRVIEHWLDSQTMIIGGAANSIRAFRAKHRLVTMKSRKKLAEETAEVVNIRATGHGWCLSAGRGCGGQGLYEFTRCRGCSNGVIDSSHIHVWKSIYAHQRELLATAADCGPSGQGRIARDLAEAEAVLRELGVAIEPMVPA